MRNYTECKTCNEWHWTDQECEPIYLVYYEDYMGDEAKEVRATDHEDAALKFASWYNTHDCDYNLMDDTIDVKVVKDDVSLWFCVGAEPSVYYTSKKIEPPVEG